MAYIKRILKFINKKKRGRFSVIILFTLFIISLLAPFIANDIPIVCKSNNGLHFPVVQKLFNKTHHHKAECNWSIHPLIPYHQKSLDLKNGRFKSPFEKQDISSIRKRHWLGTDALGRDTFAGLLYGSSIAGRIGFFASLLSFIIGMLIGIISAYFGNNKLRINYKQLAILLPSILVLLYQSIYGFFFGFANDFMWEASVFLLIFIMSGFCIWKLHDSVNSKIRVPLDNLILWILEVYKSIPNIFFILILLSLLTKAGVINLILVIAFVLWPIVARYTRAEVLKLKEENYIKSAEVSGIPNWTIIVKHIFLNAMGPALVSFAFSFSAAILLEASLSFLGIGLPVEEVSWGSMLSEVRNNYKAWWLALFPGIAIFLVVSALNYLGEVLGEFFSQN